MNLNPTFKQKYSQKIKQSILELFQELGNLLKQTIIFSIAASPLILVALLVYKPTENFLSKFYYIN